jgi:phosphopantothenoylcysteine decarboxylase/phosphopantothenate--cysteine ligase
MNDQMYRNPATQANLERIRNESGPASRLVTILGPATGPLAHGEGDGPGRMIEPDEIVCWAERMLRSTPPFAGKHVVVTAGPTREPMDPVRVVTNRSSGRMGYELARAAWLRGAKVTLIAGPGSQSTPVGANVVRVETTAQMKDAVSDALPTADCLIMAAAPADYAPAKSAAHKTKRDAGPVQVTMEPTPDILASTAYWRRAGAVIVGFALETEKLIESAKEKLVKKQLDLIVANDATDPQSGPEALTNRVTLVTAKGVDSLPLMPKSEVAEAILDRIGTLMTARG